MKDISFIKMHGLGNDFVVFDARVLPIELDKDTISAISNRRTGVGCDQVIMLEAPHSQASDLFMRIYNADGSEVGACGNATRCVADLVMDEMATSDAKIETKAGLLTAKRTENGVTVNLGPAHDQWDDIPLTKEKNTLHLGISEGVLSDPVCVNIGNPHLVYFVDNLESIPLAELGPKLEHNALFPERTNVETVQVITKHHLRVNVWERGAGITRACGTGACAALVAACRRGIAERCAKVELPGGILEVKWLENNQVLMTGPTAISFTGIWHIL